MTRTLVLWLRIVALAEWTFGAISVGGMLLNHPPGMPGDVLLARAANMILSGLWTGLVALGIAQILVVLTRPPTQSRS